MKNIAYSKTAAKFLFKMPKGRAQTMRAAIIAFANGGRVDAVVMKGADKGLVRIRTGAFRAIVDDDGKTVTVLKIGPRGDVYK